MSMPKPPVLWRPPTPGSTSMDAYRRHVNAKFNVSLDNSRELHRWSVDHPQEFWLDVYGYLNLTPPLPFGLTKAYNASLPMSSVPPFYEGLELNYAENALEGQDPNGLALIGLREGEGLEGERLTWAELKDKVRRVSSALRRTGVQRGDVVAALVSNSVAAIILFLASATISAVYTSIAPDLGTAGCVNRLQQVTPRILFVDSHATYKGRRSSMIPKTESILSQLSIRPTVYIVPITSAKDYHPSRFLTLDSFLTHASALDTLSYTRLPFASPLTIVYSSGTTGPPKCIVHHHGLILQLKKISLLHNSLGPADTVLQYSSTSWIMFYIMNGHLTTGATTIAYDGSPLYPSPRQLLRICAHHRVTFFGTSPRYLAELEKAQCVPRAEFDLRHLRMVNTTGAPLSADQYRWFYATFPPSTHLCNVAGGTDIATSLCAADPAGPLYLGEMQMHGLGMDVDVADPDTGQSIRGQVDRDESGRWMVRPGELVVRKPFPSMPAFFWGDADGSVYRAAYFERWRDVDCFAMHDWISVNPETGGIMMHGRSDGVLNPSGIRFGSGEIYSICEGPAFNSEIAETLCVGRRRPHDRDETVFLFVKMNPGHEFSDSLLNRLRETIRAELSARHVPQFILEVEEIPVTINGKKVETAVKQLISGKDIKVSSTVVNPDCLLDYKKYRGHEDRRAAKL
ncbi:acetoacetate-CoA ligase, partial [Viridothelium virens]